MISQTQQDTNQKMNKLYQFVMKFASHKHALLIVNFISFIESSFFPLAPDLMMIPMILSDRKKAWIIAFTCTISSVLGGMLGYAIGYYLFETIGNVIFELYNYGPYLDKFIQGFRQWGFWIIVAKGLTPIPYKVVTIACGFSKINFVTFVIASCIARATRFFALAGALWYFGPTAKNLLEKYFSYILIGSLLIIIMGYLLLNYIIK